MDDIVLMKVRRKTRTRLKVIAAKKQQTYDDVISDLLDN